MLCTMFSTASALIGRYNSTTIVGCCMYDFTKEKVRFVLNGFAILNSHSQIVKLWLHSHI